MTEIHELSALELARAVRTGEVSPSEVVDHTLRRAEELDPQLGAFVRMTPELAREEAAAVERALSDGDAELPFAGVPCPIKDLTMVAGVPVQYGSAAFGEVVAPVDDGVVTLLRNAGTLMVGKTNTPELGLPAYTEPDIAPPARTPWDLDRSAGGSSGGAAAAVAAGIVPIAQGSDGGGSLRIPASACGLVGCKPSRGRVSPGPYGAESAGLVVQGVVTRDVRDTAAALDVLSSSWPGDVFTLPEPAVSFLDACEHEPRQLRVGVLTDPVIDASAVVDPACRAAAEDTGGLLAELGHHVETAPVPFSPERWSAFEAIWAVQALTAPVPDEGEEFLVPLTRWLRDRGRTVSGVDYARAINAAQLTTREAVATWAPYDVVVAPTLARPPAKIGELRNDADPAADFAAQMAYTPWTSVWNLTGMPAISVPVAWTGEPPLPIGVMFGGGLGSEAQLLSLAAQVEQARPWRHRRPPVW